MTKPPRDFMKPHGATLHLGGEAWAHADLAPLLAPTDAVTPFPNNPRRGDQPAITASITDHGLYAGVIAQRTTGHILIGNHRFHALTELGAEQVPVTWLDVDDTRAAAIVARDNHTSDLGSYDDPALLALLTMDEEVLALSGYDEETLVALRRAVENLDFVAGVGTAPAGTPVGDLAPPIDLDGDAEKVTVTLDPGNRPALYALLKDLPYVRNITNQHVRATPDA